MTALSYPSLTHNRLTQRSNLPTASVLETALELQMNVHILSEVDAAAFEIDSHVLKIDDPASLYAFPSGLAILPHVSQERENLLSPSNY